MLITPDRPSCQLRVHTSTGRAKRAYCGTRGLLRPPPLDHGCVLLDWEPASGRYDDIRVVDDMTTWKTVASVRGGPIGVHVDEFTFAVVAVRYVRVQGIKRTSIYGCYRLFIGQSAEFWLCYDDHSRRADDQACACFARI